MQRILRINLLARNQALKAKRKKNLKDAKAEWREHAARQIAAEKTKREFVKDERKNRREDWIAGPLASKRDAAEKADLYGTVSGILAQGPNFPQRARNAPRGSGGDKVGSEGLIGEHKEWEGEGNEGNIVAGDRVVVIQGHESIIGQIGTVNEVQLHRKELAIEGLNMADVVLPEGSRLRDRMPFQSMELPLPLSAVRLVYRSTDDATGKDRDVIVKHLRGGAPYFQREANSSLPRHTRFIAGEDVEIPWPEDDPQKYQIFNGDTSRFEVEYQSYTPSLDERNPVLPHPSIVDELNEKKYDRDRAWHEDEYVRLKVLEDARAVWYESRKLKTPAMELAEEKKRVAAQRAEEVKQRGVTEATIRLFKEVKSAKKKQKVAV
ncbi:hypothetical protein EDD37DRAFT_99522 [Exophiala viscosa]|uniref:KOW domain-containing protein n=1 Tax=Exophiala viscosa TaxID=2486360 RepID=A0AAN6IGF6_9EURO|nr:hypothetical protein EDD36DRAFT_428540 [Exophiala viscosa]KAI1630307.1 hypothetical protein EDD37DRAFT_99522 [Exophiala viscosa]